MTMLEQFQQYDGHLLIEIQKLFVCDALTPAMKFITSLGDRGMIWIAITLVLLMFRKTRKAGILTAIAIVISFGINNMLLKDLVGRVRPYETFDQVHRMIGKPHDWSFPSGHSACSFAAAVSIALSTSKKLGIPALILAVLIAFSRLYLGVHYPSDVVCGALSGGLIAYIVYRVNLSREESLDPPRH